MADLKRAGLRSGERCSTCGRPILAQSRFCGFCGTSLLAAKAADRTPSPLPLTERRHLTVQFFDLVGSAALATSLDPEDCAQVIWAFHQCLAAVVTRFGGFVARYVGDGVLVYFGYPWADEHDAERAVACALAAIEAAGALTTLGHRLEVRVGIAMGVAVIGDIARTGALQGPEVAGEAPNLAARLQAMAAPNTIVVADEVHRLLGHLFQWRDLGHHRLKGWNEPVRAWQVLRAGRVIGRFKARQARSIPFVGRAREIAQLRDAWHAACAGAGRLVLVRGEPGLGKSCLVAQFRQGLVAEPHALLHYFCSPHQQEAPLYPCIQQIEHVANFQLTDNADAKRAKLQALWPTMAEHDFAVLAELLQIPLPESATPFQPLSPHTRRQRTLEVMLDQLARLSRSKPVLVVVEDAHWSDSISTELLGIAAKHISDLPVLVVVTARPEFRPDWADQAVVECIDLNPLEPEESRKIVQWTAGSKQLPAEVLEGVLARSDGVPLYLEELTRTIVETADQTERPMPWSHGAVAVPSSLHASLLARLDQLRDGREIAEVASAIGRDFDLDMLERVTRYSTRILHAALSRLVDTGLVLPHGPSNIARYRFKHALLQDAAYGMMVRSRRQSLHAQIAQVLEERLLHGGTPTPQLLAHHFTEAGMAEKAALWWLRAGLLSLRQSAVSEALAQLRRGLDIVASSPNNGRLAGQELDLQIAFSKALLAKQGWAAAQTGEALAHSLALCSRHEAPPQLLTVLFGQWTHTFLLAELAVARKQAEDILLEGERRGDPVWIVMGCYSLGYTAHSLGCLRLADESLRRGIALFDPDRRDSYASPVVGDPRVMMRCYAAWVLLCMGRFVEARQALVMGLSEAREVGQVLVALPHALFRSAYHAMYDGSYSAALATLNELQRIVDEHGIAYYGALSAILRGRCLGMSGEPRAGLGLLQHGLAAYRATGSQLYIPGLLGMEAEVLGKVGAIHEGIARIDEATRFAERTGESWAAAEIERIRGDLLRARGAFPAAEAAYRRAAQLARAQEAQWFELRAATGLAGLLRKEGRSWEATEVLTPIVRRFDPAEASEDLAEARAVLASLPYCDGSIVSRS